MTTVCAGCGAHLGGPEGGQPVSHGTCPACAVKMLTDAGFTEEEARQIVEEER